jgi:ADP-ribosylglycohydrolase
MECENPHFIKKRGAMTELLRDKIRGSFIGLAVGDALGMPVETMTKNGILEATEGKGVRDYLPPIQRRIKGTTGLPPGSTTDDTQLTLTVAKSIVERGGLDIEHQARMHVEALKSAAFGWGRTTADSVKELREWFRLCDRTSEPAASERAVRPSRTLRAPGEPASVPIKENSGCGNGVAMKIVPLAIWHFARLGPAYTEPFLTDAISLGLMTHGDPRASFAAVAVGAAVGGCLDADRSAVRLRPEAFAEGISRLINMYVEIAESRHRHFRPNPDCLSDRLKTAWALRGDLNELRRRIGTKCFSLESVPFSLAVFLRRHSDFEEAVLETVNAGGDTDSNAGIVGALCGALCGESRIPQRLVAGLRGYANVSDCADALYWSIIDREGQTGQIPILLTT